MNNDLISREALRKAFHERIYYFDKSSWDEANAIIDNAPAAETASDEDIKGAYELGYKMAKHEIPQSEPTGDLIRREDLMKEIGKLSLAREYGQGVKDCIDIIENVRSFYLPFCIKVNNVTDEDIQAIKDIMEDYRPQVLRLEDDRSNGTWINRGIVRECPECHCYCFLTIDDKIEGGKLKFCPNCGTHLNKPEESAN